jgi:hypothetical protein
MNIKDIFKMQGVIIITLKNIYTGKERTWIKRNTIITTGKTAIARRLGGIGTKTNEGQVTYGAVGTGTNAPAVGDVKLQVEIARKQVSSASHADNVVTIRVFFNSSEGIGTLKEFGLFGEDASGTVDSGTLFNRVAINITKTATDTLTFSCSLTVS